MGSPESSERFCPAALAPLTTQVEENGGSATTTNDLFCHCKAGPQRQKLSLLGLTLPFDNPRAGKFVCGKSREELDN